MLKKLVIESNGYVYVYHSGLADSMRFMGMSEDSYKKAKSSYKVLCFVCIGDSYEETEEIIREDYKSGEEEEHGLDYMNISDNKSIDKSLDCAKNFFENVVGTFKKDVNNSFYFVDLDTGKGVKLHDSIYSGYPKTETMLGKDVCIADSIEGTVVDFNKLINDSVEGRRKNLLVKNICRNSYIWRSKYCRMIISENDEYSMIGLFSGVNVDGIPDIQVVEEILKKDTDIAYEPNEIAYWL